MRRTLIALLAGSALVLSACSLGTIEPEVDAEPILFPSSVPSSIPSSIATVDPANESVADVVAQVLPAVVNVVSDGGEGTGFIVREDGIIVTNYHVVEQASSWTVVTSAEDPQEYEARVIGGDIQADLAILDIEAEDLPTVPLGDSDQVRLGQRVVAIGYALGLAGGPSVTAGIVSSLTREITVSDPGCAQCENGERVYTDVIQTDAAINPGNSGGPLVDLAGNVVGINSAGTTSAENIGFAIQINSAKPTIEQAAETPNEPVAFMGIGAIDASDPEVQVQADPPVDEGAWIADVVVDGPADDAGVEVGDVVVGFDGVPIATADELGEQIRAHEPGDVVEVDLVRSSGERVSVSVELGTNPLPVT
ncbi:MAG TPA: trypsin-like peptidase domain-containing protein [Actinomycetota bacterium]|jgi:S1-C subfamily serine protease